MKIRKLLAGLLALAMMISMVAIPVSAVEINQDSFTMKASAPVTVDGTADQTVSVVLSANESMSIVALEGTFSTKEVENTSYIGLTDYESPVTLSGTNYFYTQTGAVVYADADLEGYSVAENGAVMTAVYTVSKDTPTGTYTVQFNATNIQEYDFNQVENAVYTATISVTNTSDGNSTSEYTASISTTATNNAVVNGQDIEVKVNVGGTAGEFSSAEIVLDYDPAYLTYKSAATSSADAQAPDYEEDTTNGTLTIRDYGEVITAADGVYTVTFTAAKGGSTNVELKSAGFSTELRAETDDLLAATGLNELDVTINHKVTVNNADAGSVAPDGSFEYTIPNYDGVNNDYTLIVTMGGVEQTAPTIGTDGKFTISSVTGDLEITYTATAKIYNVTWSDEDSAVEDSQQVTTVTHGTDITFDVPANLDPVGTTDGYKYVVTVTETNDTSKTITVTSSDNGNGLTYTIDGDLIEADITITVKMETVKADTVIVTVNGEDVTIEGADGNTITVAKGDNVTLVLDPETGYTYEVKLGEVDITADILDDNKYTIEGIAESVTVTVTKTLDKTSVDVQKYLTLDGSNMWLVTVNGNGTTQIEGKTYSYNGENMYWSAKYQAYCYLVVAENLDTDTAKTAIGDTLVEQAAAAVNYEMDVNMSDTMDVNDAQLVWNMYNNEYSGFTTNVVMEKFLRADVNATVGVDSTDAAAIISAIKNA